MPLWCLNLKHLLYLFILPPKLKEFILYNRCQLSCHTQIWYELIVPNLKATFYYYGI